MGKESERIEYVRVPLKPGDWEKIESMLVEDGFQNSGVGIRDMLIDLYENGDDEEGENEEEAEPEDPAVNPALAKLFEYIAANPDAVKKAASLGKSVLFSTLKKKMGL